MRALVGITAVAFALTACGGAVERVSSPTTSPAENGDTTTTSTTVGPPVSTTVVQGESSLDDAAVVAYLAAIEDLLAGTTYEGASHEAPEVFVATGVLFCDRLDEGLSPDEVLDEYVVTLTGGPTRAAEDDVLVMAGGLLGAGVVTLCPHHMALVEASS